MNRSERAFAILTAAGAGTRLGAAQPKALVQLAGCTLVERAARGLASCPEIGAIVITAPPLALEKFIEIFPTNFAPGVAIRIVPGADTRQRSIATGLAQLPDLARQTGLELKPSTAVVIHDAARALTPSDLASRVIAAVTAGYPAVIPALPVTDTIKEIRTQPAEKSLETVTQTLPRHLLRAVQTPQGFTWEAIQTAHRHSQETDTLPTSGAPDDAALAEAAGIPVYVIPGTDMAAKITTAADLEYAQFRLSRAKST